MANQSICNLIRTIVIYCSLGVVLPIQAVELSDDGMGDVLIFPFYIAENGWDTYINVQAESRRAADPDSNLPALSLRVVLREGRDGEVIDSFNTYASYERGETTWRAALYRNDNGETVLRVAEGQCLIDSSGQAHEGSGVELPVDASVGMIEVYSVTEPSRHGRAPEAFLDCEGFAENWQMPDGVWSVDPSEGFGEELPKATRISGEGILVNVSQGLSGVFQAAALADFTEGQALPHSAPGSENPSLDDAMDPDFNGIGGVQRELYTQSLSNDVTALDDVNATTDWIISYPTSGYANAPTRPFEIDIEGKARYCSSFGVYGAAPQPDEPRVTMSAFDAHNVFFSTSGDGAVQGSYGPSDFATDPQTEAGVALCNAVNILTFDQRSSILVNDDSPYRENVDDVAAGESSHVWWAQPGHEGVAALAFRVTRFVNGQLNGGSTLANYLLMSAHRRNPGPGET